MEFPTSSWRNWLFINIGEWYINYGTLNFKTKSYVNFTRKSCLVKKQPLKQFSSKGLNKMQDISNCKNEYFQKQYSCYFTIHILILDSGRQPVKLFLWKFCKQHWFAYFCQPFVKLLFNSPIREPVKLIVDLESIKAKFHYNLTAKSFNTS